VLLVKLAIVSVALSWGAVHHFIVRPRLERGDTPVGLRRSLLGESSVALAVLLAAAVLVNSAPPPRPAVGSTQATSATR
jgi:putative copper export protein